MADIRGGARLKKVSAAEKNDRSAAVLSGGGGGNGGAAASSGPATPAAEGGLAGALASALAARKSKVAASGKFYKHASTEHDLTTFQMMKMTTTTGDPAKITQTRQVNFYCISNDTTQHILHF